MASITYRALWRWHFHAGLFCIPFVIVLGLTGSIYLFKPQIDAFADRSVDSLQVTGDLHAVAGMWVSTFAMFLLITALPWTTVWGAGLKQAREFASPPVKQDWSLSRADEHAE